MKRLSLLLGVGALLVGACEKTEYVHPDGGVQEDAAPQEDGPPACGPEIYPCPPYGTVQGTIMENLTFTGWMDDNGNGNLLDDPYRAWGLDYYYKLGLAGEAKFLFLNVSAGWCSVCRSETRTLAKLAADYASGGVRLAQVIFEDNEYNPATKEFVEAWVNTYALPFPVGLDAAFKTGRYFDVAATPANFVIALRDMTINGTPVKAMQMILLVTGYSETHIRAYLDDIVANSQ